jgi:hypothetical protein
MPLNLAVPASEKQPNIPVETRVDQVSSWLAQLARGDVAEAAHAMCDGLAALNRHKLKADARLELLELYRAAIGDLLPAMKAQFVIVPLPLPGRSQRIADLNRQLYAELAYGYKTAMLEIPDESSELVVQRAIDSLAQVLATCYETYVPAPVGVWSEIHRLYRHAARQHLLDKSVPDGSATSSAALAYKRALLLAVADPYHLMQGEVIRVLDYAGRFAHLAELRGDADDVGQSGLFLVKLDGDVPPKPLSKSLREIDWETHALLQTSALATQLSQQQGGLEAGIAPADLLLPDAARDQAYRNLMKRLLKHWGVSAKRHFNRKQHSAGVDLCVGIRAIHYFLLGEQVYGAAAAVPAPQGNGELDFSTASSGKNAPFSSSRWNIVNESAGGMALLQASSIPSQIRSGEIIGLRSEGAFQWNIAVVRWVKNDSSNRIELGIQMVAPYATAVAVKPAAGGVASSFQAALLLPDIPLLKQSPRLLAPRGSLQAQRGFMVECDGKVSSYKATELVESTVAFEQFEFTPL